jgi:hypothetical protein
MTSASGKVFGSEHLYQQDQQSPGLTVRENSRYRMMHRSDRLKLLETKVLRLQYSPTQTLDCNRDGPSRSGHGSMHPFSVLEYVLIALLGQAIPNCRFPPWRRLTSAATCSSTTHTRQPQSWKIATFPRQRGISSFQSAARS